MALAPTDVGRSVTINEPEPHHAGGPASEVGDDDADAGEQFLLMPFDLGHDPASLLPTGSLIKEVLISDNGLSWRSAHRTLQQMFDFPLRQVVG
jgi:hypothetical protein